MAKLNKKTCENFDININFLRESIKIKKSNLVNLVEGREVGG